MNEEPRSLSEVMDRDEAGAYRDRDEDLDRDVHLLLMDQVASMDRLRELPEPVWVYLVTAMADPFVRRGGILYACSEYRRDIVDAMRILGRGDDAARLERLTSVAARGGSQGLLDDLHTTVGDWVLRRVEERVDLSRFDVRAERIALMRAHRATFRALRPRQPPAAVPESLAGVLDLDAAGGFARDEDLDDALWRAVAHRMTSPAEATRHPEPVRLYYASRLVEWEVANGGFPQAVYNALDWFPMAAEGYRRMGRPAAAELIDRAAALAARGERRGERFDAGDIGALFRQFGRSDLARLDREIRWVGLFATDLRIAYVREHREAFHRFASAAAS